VTISKASRSGPRDSAAARCALVFARDARAKPEISRPFDRQSSIAQLFGKPQRLMQAADSVDQKFHFLVAARGPTPSEFGDSLVHRASNGAH